MDGTLQREEPKNTPNRYILVNNKSLPEIKERLDQCLKVLETFQSMVNGFVLDFFLDNHWNHLPPSWKEPLCAITPVDLASFLDPKSPPSQHGNPWPLSLLALKQTIHSLSLNREQVKDLYFVDEFLKEGRQETNSSKKQSPEVSKLAPSSIEKNNHVPSFNSGKKRKSDENLAGVVCPRWEFYPELLGEFSGHHSSLKHIFRKHVKPKKQYELARMAKLSSDLLTQIDVCNVIDVGSGVGHLARFLSYGHNIQAACVDSNNDFTDSAKKFDQQLEMSVRKLRSRGDTNLPIPPAPVHVNAFLDPDMDLDKFHTILAHKFSLVSQQRLDGASHERTVSGDTRTLDRRPLKNEGHGIHEVSQKASAKGRPPTAAIEAKDKSSVNTEKDIYLSQTPEQCSLCQQRPCICSHDGNGNMTGTNRSQKTSQTNGSNRPTVKLSTNEVNCQKNKKFDLECRTHSLDNENNNEEESATSHLTCISGGLADQHLVDSFKYGILGLHTCGDLGPVLIKMFSQDQKAKALLSVGCCYMKMEKHFPMSTYLQHHSTTWKINYTNAELACHAIEMYTERLRDKQEDKLKVHCYRALLERELVRRDPKLRHTILKTVTRSEELSFADYAMKATSKLSEEFSRSDFETEEINSDLEKWWEVVTFYTIRLALAPLIETVIQLDRCLYLNDCGLDSLLMPLFDPRMSPRNQLILAVKPDR